MFRGFALSRPTRTRSLIGSYPTSAAAWATENAGLENDGQLRKESQGLENAGLENDGETFSQLWAKLWGLENAGLKMHDQKMQDWKMTDLVN